jgi:hypothetical protein
MTPSDLHHACCGSRAVVLGLHGLLVLALLLVLLEWCGLLLRCVRTQARTLGRHVYSERRADVCGGVTERGIHTVKPLHFTANDTSICTFELKMQRVTSDSLSLWRAVSWLLSVKSSRTHILSNWAHMKLDTMQTSCWWSAVGAHRPADVPS